MEPCKLEERLIPGFGGYWSCDWCVTHDENPDEYDPETDGWVCETYAIGKRREERPQDAALRALEALSEALEEEKRTHHYEHDYALVSGPLGAVKSAVDQAIKTLEEEN